MEVTSQSGCVGASPVCPCRCPAGMPSKKSGCTGRCACPQMDGWVTCAHCLSKAEKTPVYNSRLSLEGWLQVWGTQDPALANWPPGHSWGEPHGSSSDTDVPPTCFCSCDRHLRVCVTNDDRGRPTSAASESKLRRPLGQQPCRSPRCCRASKLLNLTYSPEKVV